MLTPRVTMITLISVLIPRLATIGVSNSSISNKTKRRDITERLINAYKAILCSCILY